ncbi:coiled-coil domain-containing protein 171 isoform X1 [Oryzias melastigma]|uniref:coiled-coil domain-containing protein 171 isoform X1 n=3 Tax=Oryzias melastigma TaxID=30732 RepID=UPI000CF7B7E8|nr:coiled-coil domain-containing protein 171 isoform X1 [Oryzias melastigma]
MKASPFLMSHTCAQQTQTHLVSMATAVVTLQEGEIIPASLSAAAPCSPEDSSTPKWIKTNGILTLRFHHLVQSLLHPEMTHRRQNGVRFKQSPENFSRGIRSAEEDPNPEMPQKDEQAGDRGRKERRHKDEERGGGARQRGGRRPASEGGEGSEETRRLRWRINQLEKEKVTLTANHNQQVCGLQAELARLRSSLERGEAQRAELQFQLTVSRRDGERAAELSRDREALAERAERLQQTVEELQTALHITRRARDEDQHALQLELEERDRLVQSLGSESQRLHHLLQEQKEALQESERRITEVERQRQREVEVTERQAEELKFLVGREERIQREKEESDQRVKALEAGLEAERAAHLESKFSCEVMQLRLRDLEAALAVERSGLQEAQRCAELLRAQLGEAERAHSLQTERSGSTERALQRLQDQWQQSTVALTVAMETETATRRELEAEQRKLADAQALLEQAVRRQSEAEEAFTTFMKQITDVLHQHRSTAEHAAQPAKDDGKLSPAELLQLLESSFCSFQHGMDEAHQQVQDLLQAAGRLQQEKEDLQLLTSNQKKHLDEYQQLCAQLQEEVTRLRQQSSDWSMQLQGLQEELQREEDRGAEMKQTVEGHQQESAERLSFLHRLYQRLLAGQVLLDQPQSILGDFTWEELCGVISEQAEQLTSDLQEANRQTAQLQTLCEQRSLRLRDLQRSQETTLTQLEERVRRREEAWRRRHTQTQSKLQLCRSQCVALRDHASSLEQRCSSLTSDLSGAQKERSSSLLACALLSGALSHAHRRLSALSQQKRLLCRRLEEKEQLEEEVRRLAEALGGENEEQDKGGRTALRRWRRSMCAVLVARRWSLLARKTQVVFRVERGGATVCVCADPATAATKGQDSSQTDRDGVCARWLQSQQLSSAVLASMSDLRGALTLSGSSPPVVIPAARSGLSRLLDHLFSQSAPSDLEPEQNSLSDRLRRPTPTQPDLKALVSTLQQHFLLFSQRLHSAEVERRSLRVEVANLKRGLRRETEAAGKTVSVQHFHSVWAELRQALSREQEAQTLIQEQTNQMRALQQSSQELSEARREVSRKERSLRIVGNRLSEAQREKRQLEERLQSAEDERTDASRRLEGLIHWMKTAESHCKQVRESLIQSQHSLSAKPRLLALDGAESIMGTRERSVCQSFLSAVSQLCLTCSSRMEWLQQEVSAHRSHVTALRGELQDACLRDSLAFVPVSVFQVGENPETSNVYDVEQLSPKPSSDFPNKPRPLSL